MLYNRSRSTVENSYAEPVFERMLADIDTSKPSGRAFVIGINGIDCSGKSMFAASFERFLRERGQHTQLISLDSFHNPSSIRHAGHNIDKLYYERVKKGYTYNYRLLVKEILEPARRGETVSRRLTLVDMHTDNFDIIMPFSFGPDTIVLLEGVYLFIDRLAPYIDYKVYLDISFEESVNRARARDPEEVCALYKCKYLPAQDAYLAEYPPERTADIIIDNTDWRHPTIKFFGKEY